MPNFWVATALCAIPLLASGKPPSGIAAAPQDEGVLLNADFAWGRHYRTERLNPVVVTIDNPGPEIRGAIQLRWSSHPSPIVSAGALPEELEGGINPLYDVPVVIPEKSRRRYFVGVQGPDRVGGSLWAFLTDGRRTLRSFGVAGTAIPSHETAVAQIGAGEAPGLARAGARILLARADEVPNRWHAYAPIECALWLEADAGASCDGAQAEALKRWIAFGGHLIVARSIPVGFAGTFLEELAGVRTIGFRPHADWESLGAVSNEKTAPAGEGALLEVSTAGPEVLARAGNRPLIVRRNFGRGRVTFLAFDPAADFFRNWTGAEGLWRHLLGLQPRREVDSPRRTIPRGWQGGGPLYSMSPAGHLLGSDNLSNHLMSQPGVPVPPIGFGLLLLMAYAALIGPVDYFVLRRMGRLERTWITFPAAVAVFALILVFVGFQMKRDTGLIRDVLIEDHLPDGDLVRSWSLTTIMLPGQEVIDAEIRRSDAVLRTVNPHVWGPQRVSEGRALEWPFPYGTVGIAVAEWGETGSRLRVERAAPDSIRIVNTTGASLDAFYVEKAGVWELGRVPEGESLHELGTPLPSMAFGQYHGRPTYGTRSMNEQAWVESTRWILRSLCLQATPQGAPQGPLGFASSMDLRRTCEEGGGALVAWTEGKPALELSRGSGHRVAYRLVRAFTKHD